MWSYSGDPSTSDLDYFRFKIGDTDEDEQLLQDEEVTYVILKYTDQNRILYNLYDRLSVMFDIKAVNAKLGPESEDTTTRAQLFKERKDYYKSLLNKSGTPTYFQGSDKVFKKGMFGNA